MQTSGAVDVVVDVAELERVHGELTTLIDTLDGLDRGAHHLGTAELGGAEVADVVGLFTERWATRRRQLLDHLRDCVRYLEQAVTAYTETEDVLTRAAQPAGPEGSAP